MKLKKGSPEAKRFMAKIRAKKKSTKKAPAKKALVKKAKVKKAPVKKISGIKQSNKLKKDLKAKKIRLVHGYETVKRKLSGLSGLNNPNYIILEDIKVLEYRRKLATDQQDNFLNVSTNFKSNSIEYKKNKKISKEYTNLIKYYTLQINKLKKLIK